MRILLTNDDGISAQGLNKLCACLAQIADVYVFAPTFEQSATGHGITVKTPLRITKWQIEGAKEAFAVDGLPADCVKLACEAVLDGLPDLVISGANHGTNLASDVIYSGTVSAALEGYLLGRPSLAVSLEDVQSNLPEACQFVCDFVLWWQQNNWQPKSMFNINVPAQKIKGSKYAQLGVRVYRNTFEERIDPRGNSYYWLSGSPEDQGYQGRTDVEAMAEGYITITPLSTDLTNYKVLDFLKENEPLT
ncbi:MAG: 5'/3'-nucleotidase SurE [Bacillota bacterium]|jgi:5'-nucleotidase